jgi:hypothetical protein
MAMTKEDEQELHRLCDLLRRVEKSLEVGSPLREAVIKAAYGVSLAFIHGFRSRVDELFARHGTELTAEEKDHLRSMGIEPDAPLPK